MPIERITLHNFAAYKDTELTGLSRASMIAVLGENGEGKTALLQAIRYACYGVCEIGESQTDLVREGQSEMFVEIEYLNIPKKGDRLVIRRELAKGKSKARIELNGEVEGVGEQVAKFVTESLGADDAKSQLVAFFGGEADSIINVRASERLETIQETANVSIYETFGKKIARMKKETEQAITDREARIDTLRTLEGELDLAKGGTEAKARFLDSKKKLDTECARQSEMSAEIDRISALIKEKENLQMKREGLSKQIARAEKEVVELQTSIDEASSQIASYTQSLGEIEPELSKIDITKVRADFQSAIEKVAQAKAAIDLRQVGVEVASSNCPLCGDALDKHSKERWKEELPVLRSSVAKYSKETNHWQNVLDRYTDLQSKRERLAADRIHELGIQETDLTRKKSRETELKSLRSELDRTLAREKALAGKLKGVNASIDDYNELSRKIGILREEMGRARQDLESVKTRILEAKKRKQEIELLEGQTERLKVKRQGLDVAAQAFSRYGIPYDLIKGLNQLTEQRATELYRYFDAGSIAVENVEDRGKPGIEYRLINRTGKRSFKQLSRGQRAMVAFCIRMAISKIVAQSSKGLKIDFLVLDELTGSLSQKKREDLVKAVKKLLQSQFAQVFVISHVDLRDVFQMKILAEMKNGISDARVL